MTELLYIHAQNPQPRVVSQLVRLIQKGGVVVLPTDSGYSFCCALGEKNAIDRIRRIRDLDKQHYFTLFCRDFSEVATYGQVDNTAFRFLKAHTPAPITFILQATREVPKRLMQSSRRTIGVRIPDSALIINLVAELGDPLMSVSVECSQSDKPPLDAYSIYEKFSGQVEAVVDDGLPPSFDHTTVVNLIAETPEIIRQGCYSID